MFEAWGRVLYRRRRLILSLTLVLVAFGVVWGTGVFGKLSSGDNFTPPASQSQREANQAARVFGRNDADVVVLYRSASMTVSDPGYRQAVTAALGGLPRADVARGHHVLVHRIAQPGQRRPARYLRGAPAHRGRRRRQAHDLRRDQDRTGACEPGRQRRDGAGRRDRADGGRDQFRGHRGHRQGRGLLDAGLADPAAADLRQPGRGLAAGGDRRRGHPRLVHRAAAAHHGHHGVHLLGEHHHDPGPGPRHRLRALHGHPVPRGTAPAAHRRAGGRPDGGHRGADRRGLGRHGRGRADQPDAVPRGLPAVDGLRRGGHRRGRHAGRADRAAGAARRPRLPGQRAAHPPLGAPAGPGRGQRGLVPAGAQRHAQARRLRHGDRDRAAGPRRAVPAHLLGRHGRQDAARRLDGQAGVADAGQ